MIDSLYGSVFFYATIDSELFVLIPESCLSERIRPILCPSSIDALGYSA